MVFPNIDPVVLHVFGPFSVRWYSLAYLLGVVLCRYFVAKQNAVEKFATKSQLDDAAIAGFIGLIVCARIAYILFYQFTEYMQNPIKMVYIWEGGLSWHGGAIGMVGAVYIYAKIAKIEPYKLLDTSATVVPIAIFFGRIANFINAELYGKPTSLPIGVVFPTDPLQLPRHPSQLYEAFAEGIVLFGIMQIIQHTRFAKIPYFRGATFMCGYAICRFMAEFWRQPDATYLPFFGILNMGQVLCLLQMLVCVAWKAALYKNYCVHLASNAPNKNNTCN